MANLGSDNTPIEGESFGLPSGFSIDENSGNLAIRDTNGNVVAEWDETNAQWDFANNTLNNVDALNSNSVSTESVETDFTNAKAATSSEFNGFGIGGDQATFSRGFPTVEHGEKLRIRLQFDSNNRSPLSALVDFSSNNSGAASSNAGLCYFHGMLENNGLGSGSTLSEVISSVSIDTSDADISAVGEDNKVDLIIENTGVTMNEGNRITVHLQHGENISLVGVESISE